MEDFIKALKDLITEYDSEIVVTGLDIQLAISTYKSLRNFAATSYDEERILQDMISNMPLIAMATIEIESKRGAEGETEHSENSIDRSYSKYLEAYRTVVGFAG